MWLMACTAPGPDLRPATSSNDPAPSVDDTSTSVVAGDARLVEDLLAGRAELDEVWLAVAWSDGWPVHLGDDVFAFVRAGAPDGFGVAGDATGWEPVPLEDHGDYGFVTLTIPASPGSAYKFTDGMAWEPDPWARSYDYDGYGEISWVRPPVDAARLDRWPSMDASDLQPRDLAVYVPAGPGPWRALYAMDGQNLFDPAAIWGGWHLQDALDTVAPMLVVGVANTSDRFDEYTHVPDDVGYGPMGGSADAFLDFVEGAVRPHVELHYGSVGPHGLLGSSLGGLVALYGAWRDPGTWDFAASLSGTLGWGRFAAQGPVLEELWVTPNGVVVYADSGGGPGVDGLCRDLDGDGFPEDDPDSADNYCENRQFVDALAAAGMTWDQDLFHVWAPDQPHNEAAWAERVGVPLERFADLP